MCDVYGQPATLWITNEIVGITTAQDYGVAAIQSASPLQRRALLVDAQQDGSHQLIVDTGREAHLYAVSGCTITAIVDPRGVPFVFDMGHRRSTGDGVGCSDLGDGRQLVGLLQQRDDAGLTLRRTEIGLNGATATTGRSDTVTASYWGRVARLRRARAGCRGRRPRRWRRSGSGGCTIVLASSPGDGPSRAKDLSAAVGVQPVNNRNRARTLASGVRRDKSAIAQPSRIA